MLRNINGRIKQKSDTTANWNNAVGFIPLEGEIIIYTDYDTVDGVNIPAMKIGDGKAYVQDLPFMTAGVDQQDFLEHIRDNVRHTSQQEKEYWNEKVSIEKVEQENLIFV